MKITKTTVTTLELDYADVQVSLNVYNRDQLSDMVSEFTNGNGKISRTDTLNIALACLKGEESEAFNNLVEKTCGMWINTPAELFGYVELIEQFPMLFLPTEILYGDFAEGELKIWVGGYQVNAKTALDNY